MEIIADRLHVLVLFGAKHIARIVNLEVAHDSSYAAAELRGLVNHMEPLLDLFME